MFKDLQTEILKAFLVAALALSPGFSAWAQPSPGTGSVDLQNIPHTVLSDWILEPMPDWYQEGFSRGHLDIPKMLQAGFSRLQAVEIQNQMKDILAQDPAFQQAEQQGQSADWFRKPDLRVLKALQTALDQVMRAGQHEHGFAAQTLKPGDFYVVFDMDETLLQQWYQAGEKGPDYYDVTRLPLDMIWRPELKSPPYISMIPGWQDAFARLQKIPGCLGIILFTAKADAPAIALVEQLRLNGEPLKQTIKGLFTRHHLVRDTQSVKLSKDLRLIDESLAHVILVDDNPSRVFPKQHQNLRAFAKYNADLYFNEGQAVSVKGLPTAQMVFPKLLSTLVDEIEESAAYSQKQGVSFVQAYFPYTLAASTGRLSLLAQGYDDKTVIQLLRTQPHFFEPAFYVPQGGDLSQLH